MPVTTPTTGLVRGNCGYPGQGHLARAWNVQAWRWEVSSRPFRP